MEAFVRPHKPIFWQILQPAFDRVSIYDGPAVWLRGYASCTPDEQTLLASFWCQSEVRNGGFVQLFLNNTGVVVPEAVIGFENLKLDTLASCVRRAMKRFGDPYPRDRIQRVDILDSRDLLFGDLDDEFFAALTNNEYEKAANAIVLNRLH